MHFSFWRARLPATLATALLAVIMMAASPPMARALTPANTDATIELVVVQNQRIAVTVNATAAEMQALDGLHVAWQTEDVVMKIANDTANPVNVVQLNGGTTTSDVMSTPALKSDTVNATGARAAVNISPQQANMNTANDARGGSTYSTETMQPASNPAARLNMVNISPQATLRGGVVLASTAGGWLDGLVSLLGRIGEGRVS